MISTGIAAKRTLGASPVEVSPIGLGAWQFSGRENLAGKYWPGLDEIPAQAIVEATLAGRANWFDTAELYGWGKSERVLSETLQAAEVAPGSIVMATKWCPIMRRAQSIIRTIADRIEALSPYAIDLHQIHSGGSLSGSRELMRAMGRLLRDGHIRACGVSNYGAAWMRRAHARLADEGFPLASNQMPYSILNRRIESSGVLDAAKDLNITIIAYSPLEQGLATGRYHDNPDEIPNRNPMRRLRHPLRKAALDKSRPVIEALREIGQRYKATPAQVALNWLVSFHAPHVVAIPGATKLTQAQSNVGAMDFELTRDELDHLDVVSRPFR